MKLLAISFLFCISFAANAQGPNDASYDVNNFAIENTKLNSNEDDIGKNGFNFSVYDAGINTKYTEYGSGFFRNKFIMISSKKIGGLAKTDPNTGEGFKNIFCLEVKSDGELRQPLLFSRIINTLDSEDQITFSPDEKIIYFTRASRENSLVFNLYKANLEEGSAGNWIKEEKLSLNKKGYSIENPFVSPSGKQLYFSSNMINGYGGYDIFVSDILENGDLSEPRNLGKSINTNKDDKFPTFSKNGEFLYFASKGHQNLGGFDLFRSRVKTGNTYEAPLNLGNTINTKYDEIAMYFASNTKGYMASSKSFGKGRYDIYKFNLEEILQSIEGKVLDTETLLPLANTRLVLTNENNETIAEVKTNTNAKYKFNIKPFENYKINVVRDGFQDKEINFRSNKGDSRTFIKNMFLDPTKAEIVKEKENLVIKVENINFDFDKSIIKSESKITLNKVYNVLIDNPDMIINLKAHTDSKGKASYNLKLSERRAKSAKAYLISKGVAPNRIFAKGYGESELLYNCGSNCNEIENKANRRIEFIITK